MVLISCSTKEFKLAKSDCRSIWKEKIPAHYVEEEYDKPMTREVTTRKCDGKLYGSKKYYRCEKTVDTEYYFVPAVRIVDRNESLRDKEIAACVQNTCIQKYGNAKCKP